MQTNSNPIGALQGVTILDLTRVLAGPYCTMFLADFGADVIKIETPGVGDDIRSTPPFQGDFSMYFESINRNKRSITMNLKSQEGKALFTDLVKRADVVVENFRPGVMEKFGLGYEALRDLNEKIIYAEISGFGSYGPYAQRPGYDLVAQAMGGLMHLTGKPSEPPTQVGASVGDTLAGMNAVIGILMALRARDITGKGQKIDVALVDSIASLCCVNNGMYFSGNGVPCRVGNEWPYMTPFGNFAASDGYFVITCGNMKLTNLCMKVIGREDLVGTPEFINMSETCKNQAPLNISIEQWAAKHTVSECLALLSEAGIPAAPVLNIEQMAHDEHIAGAREMFVDLPHPTAGSITVTGNPIKLSDTAVKYKTCAPKLGASNEEIYTGMLGVDQKTLEDYRARGII
ncbi:MAG: CoA transferase [Evtepia sp.]